MDVPLSIDTMALRQADRENSYHSVKE